MSGTPQFVDLGASAAMYRSINRTRMTLMTLIIADKPLKDQRQSASSASSAFYEPVH
jgi:hypothetical protein